MAETVLIPVAKQILGKLGSLGMEQIGLAWTLEPELERLRDTVSAIQAVLLDAEEKQFHNRQVKNWLGKLSEVMYDADDLLDDFATEAARGRMKKTSTTMNCWSVVCFLVSAPKQFMYCVRMAHAVKAIRERLEAIKNDRDFHLEVLGYVRALFSEETDSLPPTFVVGREVDKENIIQMLLDSGCESNIAVVPIVGIGGLGKTTLAQLVFDDERIKVSFDVKVWVYISQCFDVKAILRKMLQSMSPGCQVSDAALNELQGQLREKIRDKRFLFVLDDVWEEKLKSWETLAKYLTIGAAGSKVLVTTRSSKVAEVGGKVLKPETSTSAVLPYLLEGLSLDESWSLLLKKALDGEVPQNPVVERTGKDILRKCCGVPLAVSTVAGLLSTKDPETEWPLVLQNELSNISKEENPIMSTLQLSFNNLPSHLKDCFSYCKLFPKGHEFDVQRLILLWRAQGYLESGDEGWEDMGLHCFKILWWRSFFQEVKIGEFGNIRMCRMHDLMHDLATSVTGEKILRCSSPTILKNVTRHLAVLQPDDNDGDDDDAEEEALDSGLVLGDASKLRTLMCDVSFSREEWERIIRNSRRLRVLVMLVENLGKKQFRRLQDSLLSCGGNKEISESDSGFSELMHSVSELKHLRFLSLGSQMEQLPDSVTKLLNLQVLDLSKCTLLKTLPGDIRNLVNLEHIFIHPWNLTHMPKGIGQLTSLQTLPVFIVGNGDDATAGVKLDELKGLNSLRGELIIKNLSMAEFLGVGVYVLKNKLLLQSLVLQWDRDRSLTPVIPNDEAVLEITLCPHPNLKKLKICRGYAGAKLPNWMSSLSNLTEISFEDCRKCEHLPPLHEIPSLKKLRIENCPKLKGIDNTGSDLYNQEEDWPCFPCLVYLSISHCLNLTRLPTFPALEGELELTKASLEPFIRTLKMSSRGRDCLYKDTREHDTYFPPLSRLTNLSFDTVHGLEESISEDILSNLISLRVLRLKDFCGSVKLLNWLSSIPTLTTFHLLECDKVEYLPPVHRLPSLKLLEIKWCRNLKGWWKKGNSNDDCYYYYSSTSAAAAPEEAEWLRFPSLSRLIIFRCPNLTLDASVPYHYSLSRS